MLASLVPRRTSDHELLAQKEAEENHSKAEQGGATAGTGNGAKMATAHAQDGDGKLAPPPAPGVPTVVTEESLPTKQEQTTDM